MVALAERMGKCHQPLTTYWCRKRLQHITLYHLQRSFLLKKALQIFFNMAEAIWENFQSLRGWVTGGGCFCSNFWEYCYERMIDQSCLSWRDIMSNYNDYGILIFCTHNIRIYHCAIRINKKDVIIYRIFSYRKPIVFIKHCQSYQLITFIYQDLAYIHVALLKVCIVILTL